MHDVVVREVPTEVLDRRRSLLVECGKISENQSWRRRLLLIDMTDTTPWHKPLYRRVYYFSQTTRGLTPVSGYYFHFWPPPHLFPALSSSPSVPMMANGGRSWLPFPVPSGIALLHFLQKIHPLAVRSTRGADLQGGSDASTAAPYDSPIQ